MFFAGSRLPRKFVPCFFQEAGFLVSSCRVTITSPVNDIERQMKLEADAVHDGLLRYAQSYEYQLATDSKPVRDLLGHCLKPLAEAIRAEQLELKTSQRQKLPKYGIPLLSINPETLALITLGMLFNSITRSEFNEATAPGVTSVSYEIGQRCRTERKCDCARNRNIDVVRELLSRNRSRHAARRAAELAQNSTMRTTGGQTTVRFTSVKN